MFGIKRNKKGELILNINFNPLSLIIKVLSSLDIIFNSKIFYSIPTGLGIGFGLGIVIFSNPSSTIANTPLFRSQLSNITPYRITLAEQNFTSLITKQTSYSLIPLKWTDKVVNFISFPGKENQQIIIGAKENFIQNVKLGEQIKIEGSNNGVYYYLVSQIREIKSEDINNLMSENNARLIILNPTNPLGSKYLVALAK